MNKIFLFAALLLFLALITFGGVTFNKNQKFKTMIVNLEDNNSILQDENTALQAEIIIANDDIEELESNLEDCQDELESLGYDADFRKLYILFAVPRARKPWQSIIKCQI